MPYPVIRIPPRDELLRFNKTLITRFMKKVDTGDIANNACWRWTGCAPPVYGKSYYGVIGIKLPDGRYVRVKAHRIAVVLQNGQVSPDFEVSHICEVGLCVNPSHLIEMSPKGHEKADRIAREIREAGGFEHWLIPPLPLWPGFGVEEVNRRAELLRQERDATRAMADEIVAEEN